MSSPSPFAARWALDVAVAELTQPRRHTITRADPIVDDQAAQLLADDRRVDTELTANARRALDSGRSLASARRALGQLADHRRRVAARRARIADVVAVAYSPPLLDQLRAETASSTGRGGGGNAGPNRSIIAIAVTELLAHIRRTVGHGHRAPPAALTAHVRAWAHDPPDVDHAAALAARWVDQITTLLNPPRRWHHPGACPACDHTTAYTLDDTGHLVRHPALQFDTSTGTARCLHCPAHWDTPAALRSLARVLHAQQED